MNLYGETSSGATRWVPMYKQLSTAVLQDKVMVKKPRCKLHINVMSGSVNSTCIENDSTKQISDLVRVQVHTTHAVPTFVL